MMKKNKNNQKKIYRKFCDISEKGNIRYYGITGTIKYKPYQLYVQYKGITDQTPTNRT